MVDPVKIVSSSVKLSEDWPSLSLKILMPWRRIFHYDQLPLLIILPLLQVHQAGVAFLCCYQIKSSYELYYKNVK